MDPSNKKLLSNDEEETETGPRNENRANGVGPKGAEFVVPFMATISRKMKLRLVLPIFALILLLFIFYHFSPEHFHKWATKVKVNLSNIAIDGQVAVPDNGNYQLQNGGNSGENAGIRDDYGSKNINGTVTSSSSAVLQHCRLPKLDPWGPQVLPYIDPTYYINWKAECKPSYKVITQLRDGYVTLIKGATYPQGTQCEFRCLYPRSDWELTFGEWHHTNQKPDCDVVEVRCKDSTATNNNPDDPYFYHYLHAQIYRPLNWNEKPKPKQEVPKRSDQHIDTVDDDDGEINDINKDGTPKRAPDVHVIVLDSTSHAQLLRSMPKSLMFLREQMGAVGMPFLNKIGMNSRPNGYGFLLGVPSSPIEANPFGDAWTPERPAEELCGLWLDQEPAYVGFAFRDRNYRTMMAEDTRLGVFTWPNCYGMARPPADHYMRPFQLRLELSQYVQTNETLQADMHNGSCREQHEYLMEYFSDFLDVYDEQPKFSLSWLTWIAHDSVNGLFRMDDYFYKFLKDNERKLRNSFIFLMGDHGNRNGGIRGTVQGEVEDNNPALFLTVPKYLRHNRRLMGNLRENGQNLMTHLDIHATLLSIAKHGHEWTKESAFDKLVLDSWRGQSLIGQSILYPFDWQQPRHCGTLHIPFEYCICQLNQTNRTLEEPEIGVTLAEQMVKRMNADILGHKLGHKCAPLELSKSNGMRELIEYEPGGVYKVTFETTPGDGRFWGFIRRIADAVQNSTALISSRFPRLNLYEKQAYCVTDPAVKPYCYCRELIEAVKNNGTEIGTDEGG